MPDYRRNRVEGGTYFFTVNLLDRNSGLLVEEIMSLREAVRDVRARMPFHIDACVVLPGHLHCIWTLPPGDADFSGRWHGVKTLFSMAMPATEGRSARRFWEHTIRDDKDYAAHLDYVHFNPVKHGLVTHVADWPYSTFHRAVARGLYPVDWSLEENDLAGMGERR